MLKRSRGRMLAAILMAGTASTAFGAQAETLADAIAIAYQSNPTLQAQRATQRAVDESYVQARAGWRPTLNATAFGQWSELQTPIDGRGVDINGDGIPDSIGRGGINRANQGQGVLTLNQPLWTGGRTAAAVSAAHADVLAGQENLRRIEAQILATVIQAYADVRRDQQAVGVRQENVAVLTRQREESQARFDVGEVTRTDVALSEARLAQATAQLQSARAQLEVSRANYEAAVGQKPGELAPEPSIAHLIPGNIDEALDVADRFNPTLRAQQFTEQASRARISGAKSEHLPTVSAQFGINQRGPIDPIFEPAANFTRTVTAQVNVTVPLFAGGAVTSRVRQAVDRNNADRMNTDAQRRALQQSVTQQWNQMLAARANIASSGEQIRAAEVAAEGTRQEQQVGLRTTIDVLNAEQELRSAELNQIVSRRDEFVSGSLLLAAMGRLEARNLTPEVPTYDANAHFRKSRITWGWVPWEEAVGVVDRFGTYAPAPVPSARPVEPAIAGGLQQAPASSDPDAPKTAPQ